MKRQGSLIAGLTLFFSLGLTAAALAAGGGSGGSGGKPPVETANNLSYPALFYGAPGQVGVIGAHALTAAFPNGLSYGCLKPETIGTTTYPNTSCVDDAASVVTPIAPEACVATGGKCEGFEYVVDPALDDPLVPNLERVYWQKNTANTWQAGYVGSGTLALPVDYVDWGDNLEVKSWPVQVIRVETNTFATLVTPTLRFEMWHVFGQGTNELWGAHATNTTPAYPYVFEAWPYAVNNSASARLNISKLANGTAPCPTQATGVSQSPYAPTWDAATHDWVGTFELYDQPYGAELNIKGSYVFGYNWNLKSAVVPPEVNKGGWWRLTFYTSNDSVDFSTWLPPTVDNNTLAPPGALLTPAPLAPLAAEAEAEEEGEGTLYVPIVDQANNLTYIDVCITSVKGGGKKPR